jgi:hypothetical protein
VKYCRPSFITWICQNILSSSYRQTKEGITEDHAQGKVVPSTPDFTTINRRIKKLNIPINTAKEVSKDEYITIAIDSTGIKVTNRGLGGCKR